MADPTPVTMACPKCKAVFELPSSVVEVNKDTNKVLLQVDRTEIHAHYQTCKVAVAALDPAVPSKELAGRIHRMLDMRAYVGTGGSRACSMCGVTAKDCMVGLEAKAKRVPCCSACGNGDTHPVPKGTLSCAEWAAEQHGADQ